MRAVGVDLKTIQELLGYSPIAIMANIYAHVSEEERREVGEKMDDVFGRS